MRAALQEREDGRVVRLIVDVFIGFRQLGGNALPSLETRGVENRNNNLLFWSDLFCVTGGSGV